MKTTTWSTFSEARKRPVPSGAVIRASMCSHAECWPTPKLSGWALRLAATTESSTLYDNEKLAHAASSADRWKEREKVELPGRPPVALPIQRPSPNGGWYQFWLGGSATGAATGGLESSCDQRQSEPRW